MSKQRFYSLSLGILLLAFFMRLFRLTDQCLTNDEVIEVEDALRSTWSEILWCPDAFPPLYRVLLSLWESVLNADTHTRWLSLWLGMASVPAFMGVSFEITAAVETSHDDSKQDTDDNSKRGRPCTAALWTGFLVAVNPLMIHYSQESRAYMLYICLAAWNLLFFIRCLRFNRRSDWLWFALFGIGGCYAHYYVGLWLLSLGIVWLVSSWLRSESLRGGLLAISVMALAGLPLISFFLPDFRDTVGYAMKAPFNWLAGGYTYYAFLAGFCLGPSRAELHELEASKLLMQFLPWMSILGTLVWSLVARATQTISFRSRWFWALLTPAILPFVLAATLSSVTDLRYGVRYVAVCSIPIVCVLGIGLANVSGKKLRAFAAAVFLVVGILTSYTRHYVPRYKNEDLRSVASFLEDHVGESVFILADYSKRPFRHYAGTAHSVIPLPIPDKTSEAIDDATELAEVVTRLEQATEVAWIVISRAFHGDPHHLFRNWLRESPNVEVAATFDGAVVYRYRAVKGSEQ